MIHRKTTDDGWEGRECSVGNEKGKRIVGQVGKGQVGKKGRLGKEKKRWQKQGNTVS
ncbi:MAG: hypothetical protein PUH24_06345 [Prevotellaceae bacterium]|nr:hypothetical protein [Prevotellaceae bacterium]